MANVLAELTEQLAKKVGGDDIAKGIVEGIQAQKGVTRSDVQRQLKRLINDIDADDAIKSAKIHEFYNSFAQGADGQMTLKGFEGTTKSSTVSDAIEQVSKHEPMPGQVSMFPDSTGQMQTTGTKIREIQEARQASKSRQNAKKMESQFKEGSDGQMYLNIDGMEDPSIAKKVTNINESTPDVKNTPMNGQQTLMVDKNGYVSSQYEVEQLRKAEVVKANRNWVERRLDNVSDAWTGFKKNMNDVINGYGDASKRVGGRNTREIERIKANNEYIRTGQGSAQSKRDFYRNYKGKAKEPTQSTTASDYSSLTEPIDVANQSASGGIDWSGIGEWVHDNQLIVAGGIAGTAIIGASLLDDD